MKSFECCYEDRSYYNISCEHPDGGSPLVESYLPAVHDGCVTQVALLQGDYLQTFYEEEIMNCYSQQECHGGAFNKKGAGTCCLINA